MQTTGISKSWVWQDCENGSCDALLTWISRWKLIPVRQFVESAQDLSLRDMNWVSVDPWDHMKQAESSRLMRDSRTPIIKLVYGQIWSGADRRMWHIRSALEIVTRHHAWFMFGRFGTTASSPLTNFLVPLVTDYVWYQGTSNSGLVHITGPRVERHIQVGEVDQIWRRNDCR